MKKKHILAVDDDHGMIKLLSMVLGDTYEVVTANDPENGLKLFDALPIEGIIVDLSMPGMTGYDFIKQIRDQKGDKIVPIIVLSGTESSQERVRCLELGADDYLVKPFNPAELIARLKRIYQRMRMVAM